MTDRDPWSSPATGPVFIVGCAKSGTTLLQALLDGHPELLVMPSELNVFRFSDHPSRLGFRKLGRLVEPPAIAEAMLDQLFFLQVRDPERLARLERRIRVDPPHDFSPLDPEVFVHTVLAPPALRSHREIYRRFFEALLAATGQASGDLATRRWVEKSPHQEEYAPLLREWFPNARFLHVVRNPYATLRALRRVATGDHLVGRTPRYPSLRPSLRELRSSYELAAVNRRNLGECYRVVRYETLVSDPTSVLAELAAFLGIAGADIRLEPTLLGQPWTGNSTSGRRFSGIDHTPLEDWRSEITPYEIALVNRHLGQALRDYDYEVVPLERRPEAWRRNRREQWSTYFANRVQLLAAAR